MARRRLSRSAEQLHAGLNGGSQHSAGYKLESTKPCATRLLPPAPHKAPPAPVWQLRGTSMPCMCLYPRLICATGSPALAAKV